MTPRVLPRDFLTARRLRLAQRFGIVYPATTVAEARRTGLDLTVAVALLQQESGGGTNEFGHDPVDNIRGGPVTKARYQAYIKKRGPTGLGGMQGVGPCQLTWYSFQDEADRLGGCWKPWINMRVGFAHLAAKVRKDGLRNGLRAYNGSGPPAAAYADTVLRRITALRAAGVQ